MNSSFAVQISQVLASLAAAQGVIDSGGVTVEGKTETISDISWNASTGELLVNMTPPWNQGAPSNAVYVAVCFLYIGAATAPLLSMGIISKYSVTLSAGGAVGLPFPYRFALFCVAPPYAAG